MEILKKKQLFFLLGFFSISFCVFGQIVPKPHAPTVRVLAVGCSAVEDAANRYFALRGITAKPYNRQKWCPTGTCFDLKLDQLRDRAGHLMTLQQIKERYTQLDGIHPSETKATWSLGGGRWEHAGAWHGGAYFEFQNRSNGCFVRADFGFSRAITGFLVFLPMDAFDERFTSNDQFEAELIDGIESMVKPANDPAKPIGQ
jgi:hypothetical protein